MNFISWYTMSYHSTVKITYEAKDNFKQCRLSSPIGSDKGNKVSFVNIETDITKYYLFIFPIGKILDRQNWLRNADFPTPDLRK